MLFNSYPFLFIFLPISLIIFYSISLINRKKITIISILISSLIFYQDTFLLSTCPYVLTGEGESGFGSSSSSLFLIFSNDLEIDLASFPKTINNGHGFL